MKKPNIFSYTVKDGDLHLAIESGSYKSIQGKKDCVSCGMWEKRKVSPIIFCIVLIMKI